MIWKTTIQKAKNTRNFFFEQDKTKIWQWINISDVKPMEKEKQSFKVKDDVAGVWNTRNSQQCSHLIGDAVLHVRAEDQPDVTVLLPVQRDTRRNFNTNANRLWFTHSLLTHSHF